MVTEMIMFRSRALMNSVNCPRVVESNLYIVDQLFSGISILNHFPFGIIKSSLLTIFEAIRWKHGEAFVGIYKARD